MKINRLFLLFLIISISPFPADSSEKRELREVCQIKGTILTLTRDQNSDQPSFNMEMEIEESLSIKRSDSKGDMKYYFGDCVYISYSQERIYTFNADAKFFEDKLFVVTTDGLPLRAGYKIEGDVEFSPSEPTHQNISNIKVRK